MIKIVLKKDHDYLKEIIISGHANYDTKGKDIVCASVSSITITSINSIISLEDTIVYEENSGLLKIRVKEYTDINQSLLQNMIRMLKELQSQYPKNIEIRNED